MPLVDTINLIYSETNRRPPRIWEVIGSICLHSVDEGPVLGDLEETYGALSQRHDRREAVRWYRSQILRSIPHFLTRSISWSLVMLGDYFRVALRSLRRCTGYAVINLTGLVAGLACVLLIGVYIRHELSFDRFHVRADRIQRVVLDLTTPDGVDQMSTAPGRLAGLQEETVPDVERTIRLYRPEEVCPIS